MLALFLIPWVISLGMNLATGPERAPLYYYTDAWPSDGPPVVRGYRVEAEPLTAVRVGDRLLRAGEHDLTGVGHFGVMIALVDATWRGDNAPVPVTVERDGVEMTFLEEPSRRGDTLWRHSSRFISFAWGVVAILILLRAPPTRASRALFYALASSALLYAGTYPAPGALFSFALVVAFAATVLNFPLLTRAFLSFPEEANSLTGIHRWWPFAFAAVGVVTFSAPAGGPVPPEVAATWGGPLVLACVAAMVAVMTRNYLRSGPVGRRQLKWVLYGAWMGALIAGVAYTVGGLSPVEVPLWWAAAILIASTSYPITILIAVLRFDLFDIDRLIGATAAYNLLAVVLVGAGFLLVPRVAQAVAVGAGVDEGIGQAAVVLALASLMIPAGRRLRPRIDRWFFRERVALEQAMSALPAELATARTSQDLWETTGSRLVELLRPASCVIYAAADASFLPVFAHGRAVPPAIARDAELLRFAGALDAAAPIDRSTTRQVGDADRALFANLEARSLIPIRRGDELAAILILGEKRSGDIYTRTDLALLTALSNALASHLLRFDQDELLERTRATQEAMRRYVPGAVAEQLDEGGDLEPGEREVSVLFVDIRGYTAFSDGRQASEIFSTVNKYTETVSTIVNDCGGAVVEFNGDGMMAVFGAPRPHPQKEQASVEAARRLVSEVPRLLDGGDFEEPLTVGVGVATGPAFVGNIQGADRMIWSAIGNTTNLAARLQSLTRELDASVLIDAQTRERASAKCADFTRHDDHQIRGRREAITLFALPIQGSTA